MSGRSSLPRTRRNGMPASSSASPTARRSSIIDAAVSCARSAARTAPCASRGRRDRTAPDDWRLRRGRVRVPVRAAWAVRGAAPPSRTHAHSACRSGARSRSRLVTEVVASRRHRREWCVDGRDPHIVRRPPANRVRGPWGAEGSDTGTARPVRRRYVSRHDRMRRGPVRCRDRVPNVSTCRLSSNRRRLGEPARARPRPLCSPPTSPSRRLRRFTRRVGGSRGRDHLIELSDVGRQFSGAPPVTSEGRRRR